MLSRPILSSHSFVDCFLTCLSTISPTPLEYLEFGGFEVQPHPPMKTRTMLNLAKKFMACLGRQLRWRRIVATYRRSNLSCSVIGAVKGPSPLSEGQGPPRPRKRSTAEPTNHHRSSSLDVTRTRRGLCRSHFRIWSRMENLFRMRSRLKTRAESEPAL